MVGDGEGRAGVGFVTEDIQLLFSCWSFTIMINSYLSIVSFSVVWGCSVLHAGVQPWRDLPSSSMRSR